MINLPKKSKEKKEANISVRVRATVLERLKKIADNHGLSQSEVVEHLIDSAYEEIVLKKPVSKKRVK